MDQYGNNCATPDRITQLNSLTIKLQSLWNISISFSTFIATFFALRHLYKRTIFDSATKILLIQKLFFANLSQFGVLLIFSSYLYRSLFQINNPCQLMLAPGDCNIPSTAYFCGLNGMVFSQTGVIIERSLSTVFSFPWQHKATIGYIILVPVTLISLSSHYIVTQGDMADEYMFSCGHYPVKSSDRANIFLGIIIGLSLVNFILTTLLVLYHRRMENKSRFDVQKRFHRHEAFLSTQITCFLAFILFTLIFIHMVGLFFIRNLKKYLNPMQYLTVSSLIFVSPISALILPLFLIYRIRKHRNLRLKAIKCITTQHETQDEHIARMKQLWN